MKRHNLKWLLAVTFLILPFPLNAQNVQTSQTNTLQSLQLSFQKQEQILQDGYDAALGSLMDGLKQKGDIDQYVIVETERQRFKTEKTVPYYSDAKTVFAIAANNYYRGWIVVLQNQIPVLKEYIRLEMKADHMDNAKNAKTEQGRIEFVLADIKAHIPKISVEKPNEPILKSMVGVWKWENTKVYPHNAIIVIYSDGTFDIAYFQPEVCGKLESINGSRKAKRISRTFQNTWEYDPVKDVIREDSGWIGHRLNLNAK